MISTWFGEYRQKQTPLPQVVIIYSVIKNKYNRIENQVIYLENLELFTCIFTEVSEAENEAISGMNFCVNFERKQIIWLQIIVPYRFVKFPLRNKCSWCAMLLSCSNFHYFPPIQRFKAKWLSCFDRQHTSRQKGLQEPHWENLSAFLWPIKFCFGRWQGFNILYNHYLINKQNWIS